jgi:hypothetical protein
MKWNQSALGVLQDRVDLTHSPVVALVLPRARIVVKNDSTLGRI